MTTKLESADECLDVAIHAEHWINSLAQKTDHGMIWGLATEKPNALITNLYTGSAGIVLFYLELHGATGEQHYLEKAISAGNDLAFQITKFGHLPCAPMGGWIGYMFVFNELAKASSQDQFGKAAKFCVQRQRDQAQAIGAGIGWIQEMPYANLTGHTGDREIYDIAEGAAGAGLGLLYAHCEGIHDNALDWSVAVGNRLLEVAKPAEGGLRWQLMEDIPWPFDAPNFAHGTAGVAYFLARLFEETKDPRFLEAAIAGAGHVKAKAVQVGDNGHLVPHILDDGKPDRFYLGFCHGPPGTARLYYLLSELTGDDQWMQWSKGLDEGLLATGAPEARSEGLWNNISQCCCDAGIGDHAVSMFRATGDSTYLDLAQRVAAELVRRAKKESDGYSWPQAEHRSQPDFILAQTGYMQGAAGVGSFFIHLATTLKGNPVKIAFPDSPYNRLPETA